MVAGDIGKRLASAYTRSSACRVFKLGIIRVLVVVDTAMVSCLKLQSKEHRAQDGTLWNTTLEGQRAGYQGEADEGF